MSSSFESQDEVGRREFELETRRRLNAIEESISEIHRDQRIIDKQVRSISKFLNVVMIIVAIILGAIIGELGVVRVIF